MTLAELDLPGGPFTVRTAGAADVGPILGLLADDQLRAAAHRFYQRLGFEASHVGFKLLL